MPDLTLIVGGPGSGKTSEIVSRLAARYEADPFAETVVLVPTVRHGDQIRRRLVARCGAALRLRVEIIPQFSHQLAMGTRAPSRMLAGELLARTARREVERGPAAYFRPIAGTVGFSDLLNAAVDDLLAEAVDPRAFSESAAWTGSPRLTALGAIYAAYHAELERWDWRHPAQIALAAADALRDGAAAPPVVMLDGFHLFRGASWRCSRPSPTDRRSSSRWIPTPETAPGTISNAWSAPSQMPRRSTSPRPRRRARASSFLSFPLPKPLPV